MKAEEKVVTVEQAQALILQGAKPLPAEEQPLSVCSGLTLARALYAGLDQPPFDRSPLDGYALRAADSQNASPETPVTLTVAFRCFAGQAPPRALRPGECARVMTGAMLPESADCVVRQEDTDGGEEQVRLFCALGRHENYVFAGEDFHKGEQLLPAGTVLDAAALAVAASAGISALSVVRRPRVAVIATGDELVPPGEPLPAGKIYDSNLCYLSVRLRELGAEVIYAGAAPDEAEALAFELKDTASWADLVFSTGGVSVGQKDLIPGVLQELGAELVFHGVAMKPGMPSLFARLNGTPVFGLSGNPFAAAVALELLGAPLLRAAAGYPPLPERRRAVLANGFRKASPGRRFLRGRLENGQVSLPSAQANGQFRSLVGCNCLVDVPPGSPPLQAGETVEALLL